MYWRIAAFSLRNVPSSKTKQGDEPERVGLKVARAFKGAFGLADQLRYRCVSASAFASLRWKCGWPASRPSGRRYSSIAKAPSRLGFLTSSHKIEMSVKDFPRSWSEEDRICLEARSARSTPPI